MFIELPACPRSPTMIHHGVSKLTISLTNPFRPKPKFDLIKIGISILQQQFLSKCLKILHYKKLQNFTFKKLHLTKKIKIKTELNFMNPINPAITST